MVSQNFHNASNKRGNQIPKGCHVLAHPESAHPCTRPLDLARDWSEPAVHSVIVCTTLNESSKLANHQ